MSEIRMALVGCGGMAKSHAAVMEKLQGKLSIVAAVDIDLQKAEAMAAALGIGRVATDYREVLPDVDAVFLVLPHHLHHPVAMDCLAAGKHVLLEKPMANSEKECLELIEAQKKARKVLMIAYCMRFHPLVVRLKELLDKKAYGDVFQVSIWTEQLTIYPPGHWASSAKTLGGGQLFSHGCHYIDLLLWFLGRPLSGTHVGTNCGTPWMEKEGTSNVTIEFEGGKLGYHFGTWGARGTRLGYSIHAHCTEGMLEANFRAGKLIAIVKGEEQVLYEAERGKYTNFEMEHFVECITEGKEPLTDGPGSLQGLRVIWKLYEAEQNHTVADLRGLGLDEFQG
ncbi:MAG TPA: Gfo/Idh/MocA family oxidoreductase [Firmicutes bacterium]|nr:Gfo/Idh/MocA family oxidoreductase [Bacillota bacterium]